MIIEAAAMAAAMLGAAPNAGLEVSGQEQSAVAQQSPEIAMPVPTAAQRDEALAFTTHPFVLGTWKVPEAQRPLMRCVQILSGTRTDVETGEVQQISKIANRCSFPVRFVGEVGKSDSSWKVCVAELRVKTLMLPEGEYDLPDMVGGNCFGDVELLAAEPVE